MRLSPGRTTLRVRVYKQARDLLVGTVGLDNVCIKGMLRREWEGACRPGFLAPMSAGSHTSNSRESNALFRPVHGHYTHVTYTGAHINTNKTFTRKKKKKQEWQSSPVILALGRWS